MKVVITMTSGKEVEFNTKHTSISKWIDANFSSDKNFVWYLPTTGSPYALNFNNIEKVELK